MIGLVDKAKSKEAKLPRAGPRVKATACLDCGLWTLRQKSQTGHRRELHLPLSWDYISCTPPRATLSARHLWFQPLPGHTLCRRQAGASSCCPATCQASSPPTTAGREGVWGPLRPHPHPPTPPEEPQGHWGTRVYCWPRHFPAPSTCFRIHTPGISGGGFQNNLGIDRGLFPGKAGDMI